MIIFITLNTPLKRKTIGNAITWDNLMIFCSFIIRHSFTCIKTLGKRHKRLKILKITFFRKFEHARVCRLRWQSKLKNIGQATKCDTLIISSYFNIFHSLTRAKTWEKGPKRLKILKGTVVQIVKALINDHLRVSKVFWKYVILTIYNFAVIYPTF